MRRDILQLRLAVTCRVFEVKTVAFRTGMSDIVRYSPWFSLQSVSFVSSETPPKKGVQFQIPGHTFMRQPIAWKAGLSEENAKARLQFSSSAS